MAALPHPFTEIDPTKLSQEESNWTKSLKILEAHHQQQNSPPVPYLYGVSRPNIPTKQFVVEDFPCDFTLHEINKVVVGVNLQNPLPTPTPKRTTMELRNAEEMRQVSSRNSNYPHLSTTELFEKIIQKINTAAENTAFWCDVPIPINRFRDVYVFLRRRGYEVDLWGYSDNDNAAAHQHIIVRIEWYADRKLHPLRRLYLYLYGLRVSGIRLPWFSRKVS